MFSLFGAPALSQFRVDGLLRSLREQDSRVTSLSSRWVHFVDAPQNLDSAEQRLLERLLTYGARETESGDYASHQGHRILVTPRVGTESPWSSKATDILHVCGLNKVTRVERGAMYFIGSDANLDTAALDKLAAPLHDRMTESTWLDTDEPTQLFHAGPARPLRRVDVTEQGAVALSRAN